MGEREQLTSYLCLMGSIPQVFYPNLASLPEAAWHKMFFRLCIIGVFPEELSTAFYGRPDFKRGQFSPLLSQVLMEESVERYSANSNETSQEYQEGLKPFGRTSHRIREGKTFWVRKEKAMTMFLKHICSVDIQKRPLLMHVVWDIAQEYKKNYGRAQDTMHRFDDFIDRWSKLQDILQDEG